MVCWTRPYYPVQQVSNRTDPKKGWFAGVMRPVRLARSVREMRRTASKLSGSVRVQYARDAREPGAWTRIHAPVNARIFSENACVKASRSFMHAHGLKTCAWKLHTRSRVKMHAFMPWALVKLSRAREHALSMRSAHVHALSCTCEHALSTRSARVQPFFFKNPPNAWKI